MNARARRAAESLQQEEVTLRGADYIDYDEEVQPRDEEVQSMPRGRKEDIKKSINAFHQIFMRLHGRCPKSRDCPDRILQLYKEYNSLKNLDAV